ncbi:MAG: choice-of-anchor A family protein [Ignavibacteriales bacterium]|nr:MAG: choice-of-anchor A family protein [Ignavibacteriales bacterium]
MNNSFISFVLFALISVHSFADVQSIATVSGTHKGVNVTLPAPFSKTVFAGTFNATIDGNPTNLYCIDLANLIAYNQQYQDVSSTDSMLTYILNNYYPFKPYPYTGSASTVEKEAAAVQLALWHYADGLNVAGVTGANDVRTRALDIIADANLHAHVLSLQSFFVDIPAQSFAIGSPISFTVQAFDNMGIAMPNVTITLSTTSGTLSSTTTVTGPTGVSPVLTIIPGVGVTNATISVSGTVGIPAGTKYYHVADPNGKQKLILATPTIAARTIHRTITWFNQIDLVVNKAVDQIVANNGDIISYRITVKNTGSANAEGVEVSDQLADIFDFVSAVPSGVYNPATGIWTAGNISAGDSAVLLLQVQVDYSNVAAASFNFGAAALFNLFVLDTLIQPSADTQGKLAVGGIANLTGYSVGDQLPPNSGDVLVVGNHLTYMIGRVYNGRAVYQNYITSTIGFSADGGIFQDSVINFPAAKLHLQNLSVQLATLSQSGSVYHTGMQISLVGTNPDLNVFYLDGSLLLGSNQLNIDVPVNSTVLVNVSGDSTRMFGGIFLTGAVQENILFNFYEAEKLHISGINVTGSVLAPFAALDFPAGIITGQTMVRCMYGSGQFNLAPFTGNLTRDTTIANFAEVISASQGNMPGFFNAPGSMAMLFSSGVTGINSEAASPGEYNLDQNYPNPFNPSTEIRFSVGNPGSVTLQVYDVLGNKVADLVNGYREAGSHSVNFNASGLSSGTYFYVLKANGTVLSRKMALLK